MPLTGLRLEVFSLLKLWLRFEIFSRLESLRSWYRMVFEVKSDSFLRLCKIFVKYWFQDLGQGSFMGRGWVGDNRCGGLVV